MNGYQNQNSVARTSEGTFLHWGLGSHERAQDISGAKYFIAGPYSLGLKSTAKSKVLRNDGSGADPNRSLRIRAGYGR